MRIFENPVLLLVLALIIIVLFGASRLPGVAKSIGQSLKIFKDEVGPSSDDKANKSSDDPAPKALEGDVMDPSKMRAEDVKKREM